MESTESIRDRIFSAADEFYAATGRTQFPTVDAVRRRAGVNMNSASPYMKEWRRAQTAALAPAPGQPPDQLREAWSAVLAQIWQQTIHCAREPLRVARTEWEAERSAANAVEKESNQAFDQQNAELETAKAEIAQLRAKTAHLNDEVAKAATAVASAEQAAAAAKTAEREALARTAEIELRAAELRKELDHAHAEAARLLAHHAAEMMQLVSDTKDEISREREKAEHARLRHDTILASLQNELAAMRAALTTSGRIPTAAKRKPAPANTGKSHHGEQYELPNS